MTKCLLCERDDTSIELIDEICARCRKSHALPPPSEPLRPRIPCARCGGTALVRCRALRERSATSGDHATEYIAALAATFALSERTTFWEQRLESTADQDKPIGLFEAYICRRCGFTELYVRGAAEIPISPIHGTEAFDTGGETPYR
jgi:hypothetical protein